MGGGNLSELEISRSDSILGDNLTFCLGKTAIQPCELTLASGYSAVSHTDTVVQMKKNSIIKLLFVNHKGIILT